MSDEFPKSRAPRKRSKSPIFGIELAQELFYRPAVSGHWEQHLTTESTMSLFFNKELNSFEDLLALELDDLYDAEQRLCTALPKMAEAANSESLRAAFEEHARQTQRHVSRLEQIFVDMGRTSNRETCEAMKGLISEGSEIIDATGSPEVKDAALIGAAQRVEHYEIAAYGTAGTFAQHLGLNDVVRLLQSTLDEERETDERLTDLAENQVNWKAERHV